MLIEVEGFILKETPYGESSKIINVLTKDKGLIDNSALLSPFPR